MSETYENWMNATAFSDQSSTLSVTDQEHPEAQDSSLRDELAFNDSTVSTTKPVISIARRNERERKRVRLVNQGFAILRERVPRERCSRGRRSSKVETLRSAIMYIRQLQQLLVENQMRLQEQSRSYCYSYAGNSALSNSDMVPTFGNYPMHGDFSTAGMQPSSYQYNENASMQYTTSKYDPHLSAPWFTYN